MVWRNNILNKYRLQLHFGNISFNVLLHRNFRYPLYPLHRCSASFHDDPLGMSILVTGCDAMMDILCHHCRDSVRGKQSTFGLLKDLLNLISAKRVFIVGSLVVCVHFDRADSVAEGISRESVRIGIDMK